MALRLMTKNGRLRKRRLLLAGLLGGAAVLDNGQYDRRWAKVHMTPEEAVCAARR